MVGRCLWGRSVVGKLVVRSAVGRSVGRTGRSVSLGRSVTSLQWVGRRTTRGPEMIVEPRVTHGMRLSLRAAAAALDIRAESILDWTVK